MGPARPIRRRPSFYNKEDKGMAEDQDDSAVGQLGFHLLMAVILMVILGAVAWLALL